MRRVLITGGRGFLGTYLVQRFEQAGDDVVAAGGLECDLRHALSVTTLLARLQPDIVVHAAADVGGIGYDRDFPAGVFRNNLLMTCNVLEACCQLPVEKLVLIGSSCAYPGDTPDLLREADFMAGPMHPSVECYGFSKRALYLGARAYRKEYGLNSIFLLLTNIYGPHDKFDPEESHVVAALVRKFVEAADQGDPVVECWGTGAPIREFLYAADAAEAVYRATECYESPEPLNIGTGIGTSIRELAQMIARLTGFKGVIGWDSTKPDGAFKKVLDVSHMRAALAWSPSTGLEEGLRQTVDWYRRHPAS